MLRYSNGSSRVPRGRRGGCAARCLPCRIPCCAVGGIVPPVARSGTAAESPAAHASSTPSTRRYVVGADPPVAVHRERGALRERRRLDARRPHEGVRREFLSVREAGQAAHRGVEARPEQHLDPTLLQPLPRVVRQTGLELREDLVGRLDEDPPQLRVPEAPVAAHRLARQVLELAEGLDARVPAADEDERQGCPAALDVVRRLGEVESRQHPVAQPDRLLNGLESHRVLGEPGDREHAGPGAGREHHHVVVEGGAASVGQPHRRVPGRVVHVLDLADHDLAMAEHVAERDDHGPRVDRSRGHLGQERLVLHEVLGVDDRDTVAEIDGATQAHRRVQPREPGADDEDPSSGHASMLRGEAGVDRCLDAQRPASARSRSNAAGSHSDDPSRIGSYRVP